MGTRVERGSQDYKNLVLLFFRRIHLSGCTSPEHDNPYFICIPTFISWKMGDPGSWQIASGTFPKNSFQSIALDPYSNLLVRQEGQVNSGYTAADISQLPSKTVQPYLGYNYWEVNVKLPSAHMPNKEYPKWRTKIGVHSGIGSPITISWVTFMSTKKGPKFQCDMGHCKWREQQSPIACRFIWY